MIELSGVSDQPLRRPVEPRREHLGIEARTGRRPLVDATPQQPRDTVFSVLLHRTLFM